MKPTLVLALFTNGIFAAATGDGPKASSEDKNGVSVLNKDVFSFSSDAGAKGWCGNYTPAQCSAVCFRLGYRCYYCSAEWCNCTNYGC